MRINIVTGAFFSVPPAPCGAVEWVWYLLGKELASRGHHVTILARHAAVPLDCATTNLTIIRKGGFSQTNRIWIDLGKDLLYSIDQMLRLPPADFTITNAFWLPPVLRIRPSAGRIVPSINRYPKKQMGLYSHSCFLAACSTAIANAIKDQSPRVRHLVRLIPNVIDTTAFTPPMTERDYAGTKTLLYTGRIHPEKGIHVLVDAFAMACKVRSDLRLKVVGPWTTSRGGGGEEYLNTLRSRTAGLPVEFCEPISGRDELATLCRSAHFYCYPSLAAKGEALPVAPIEAMATGLIPIVSDLACFDDYVTPETGVRFDYKNDPIGNLAQALLTLIASPQRCKELSEAAAKRAAAFGPSAVAQLLETQMLLAVNAVKG